MLYLFDQDDNFITILSKETGLVDTWFKDYENHLIDEPFVFNVDSNSELLEHIVEENQVAFYDRDNDLRLMRMKELYEVSTKDGHNIKVKCEPSFLELYDHFVEDKRVSNGTAQTALDRVLDGSRYIGEVTVDLGNASDNFYWIDGIESVFKIINTWGGSLKDTIALDEANEIIERKLWIVQRLGTDNGLLVEPDYNAETISRNTLSYVETALWAQGASLETDDGGYTRYITFEDVEWKVSNGDPVDKPKGQKWVGDPDALEMYGYLHNGKRQHRFGHFSNQDYDDPEELLKATWQELQERKLKEIIHEATIYESDKKVSLGDTVTVLNREYNKPIELQSQITGLEYDVLKPYDEIKIIVGKYIDMNEDPLQQDVDDLKDQVNKPRPTKPIDKDSYPDLKPSTPVNVEAIGGYEVIQLHWDYTDEVFVSHYEVYGSQVSDFVPDSQHLLWRGNVSAFAHSVETDQTWYYYVRAVNYHGTTSEYSDKVKASSVRIIDDDILFGEEMAERLRELNRVSDIIGEGNISLENLHDDIPDYFKQQAKEYTDEEIKETRDDFLKDISDVYDEIDIVDGKLVDKANKDDVYTIKNIDDMFDNVVSITEYQTDVDGFIERFESAESRLYQNETAIGSMVKQDEFEDYGDKIDRRMSEWEQTADGFLSTVERVRADLDGLEIGGRNLVGKYNFYPWSRTIAGGAKPSTIGSSYIVKVEPNKTYTASRKTTKLNNRFRFYMYNTDSDNPEDIEGKIETDETSGYVEDSSLVFTFTTDSDTKWLYIYLSNQLEEREGIKDNEPEIKLEKGNRATDWSPAPEDMDERMTKAESSIVQNATNIDLKVNVDEIVSEINLKKEGIRIAGDLIHLDGLALIDDAVIKSAHIANTTIEKGHLKRAIIDDAHIDELTGKSIVAKTITTDHLDVAKLSSIAADLGVVTAGILESKNNNMRLNLNTGNLTMQNAEFTLGSGAHIEFTSRNNRLQFRDVAENVARYSGMGIGLGTSEYPYPISYVGTSTASGRLDNTDDNWTGLTVHSHRSQTKGAYSSITGRRLIVRDYLNYSRAIRFDLIGNTPSIVPTNSGSYNYELGSPGNRFNRLYANEIRGSGDVYIRDAYGSGGFLINTDWEDGSGLAIRGLNTGTYNYHLGRSNSKFTYAYITSVYADYLRGELVGSSSKKFKENISDMDIKDSLEFVKNAKIVQFDWIRDEDTKFSRENPRTIYDKQVGFILDDVNMSKDYLLKKDEETIKKDNIIFMHQHVIQDNIGRITDSEVEIQMLKARIKQLEEKIS